MKNKHTTYAAATLALTMGLGAQAQSAAPLFLTQTQPLQTQVQTSLDTQNVPTSPLLPDEKPYNNRVSLTAPLGGISLEAALNSLGRAVGLTVLIEGVPQTTIKTSFKERPLREMLSTLISVYGGGSIGYTLVNKDVLVIGNAGVLQRLGALKLPQPAAVETSTPVPSVAAPVAELPVTQIYAISGAKGIAEAIAATLPVTKVASIDDTLIVLAPGSVQVQVADLLGKLREQARQQAASALEAASALPAGGAETSSDQPVKAPADTSVTPPTPAPEVVKIVKSYPLLGNGVGLENAVKTFFPDVTALVVPESKTYILSGTQKAVEDAESTIKTLDRAPEVAPVSVPAPAPELIENAFQLVGEPNEILQAIRVLMPQVQAQLLPSQNLLIVRSTAQEQVKVIGLMNQINITPVDGVGDRGVAQRSFRLENATSDVVVQQLTTMLGSLILSPSDVAAPKSDAAATPGTVESPTAAGTSSDAPNTTEAATTSTQTSTTNLNAAPGATANGSDKAGSARTIQTASTRIGLISDRRTNTVIATGTARQLQLVASTINALDVPSRQVKLSVRIEKLNIDAAKNLGIDWNIGLAGASLSGGSSGLAVGYTLGGLNGLSLGVKLDALKKSGNVKTLTNTTLMVSDQNTVNLNTGGTLYVKTQNSSSNTPTQGTAASTSSTDFKEFPYGMQLAFTPRMSPNGSINLQVATLFSNKPTGDFANYFTVDGQKLTTNVNLMSGQNVVLGGVVTTSDSSNKDGVPLLSDIPLLGGLFSKTSSSNTQETLLIVITGEVVDQQGRPFQSSVTAPSGGLSRVSDVPVGTSSSVTIGLPTPPKP